MSEISEKRRTTERLKQLGWRVSDVASAIPEYNPGDGWTLAIWLLLREFIAALGSRLLRFLLRYFTFFGDSEEAQPPGKNNEANSSSFGCAACFGVLRTFAEEPATAVLVAKVESNSTDRYGPWRLHPVYIGGQIPSIPSRRQLESSGYGRGLQFLQSVS